MGQVRFGIFDFFGQDIFFHLFFYIFFFQAVCIRVKPGWSGSNLDQWVSSVGDDVIHDVTLLRTHVACVARATRVARVARLHA